MRVVSIDIETTGLDPKRHHIIEFGAVLDDLRVQAPLEELPRFHAYVLPPANDGMPTWMSRAGDDYVGDPYALQMNARILERIAKRTEGYEYLSLADLHQAFVEWCLVHDLAQETEQPPGSGYVGKQVKFVAAGKNYAAFDRNFLNQWAGFQHFRVHHRVVDPGMLFLDPAVDDVPPDLTTCCERAGIESEVTHEAVDDALLVLRLLRAAFPLVDGVPTRKVFSACPA